MGKILVIAEKPSVGRDLAKVLGCKQKGDGCLIGSEYVVTWAIGHLITLVEPEDYDPKYKGWKYDTLPIIPKQIKLKPISRTKKQYQIVKKWMNDKEVDSIICATDSGREGELIFRYIYQVAKCKKPFQRLWISSMTDVAIKEGFANLKPGRDYDQLFYSARCRSESDWLVGINASRAFTIRYNTLLSIGRVQTPTLAILVQRQKEINDFIPKDYWEVHGIFGEYKGIWFDEDPKETKIFDKDKAEQILNKVKNKVGVVEKIETEDKKQVPPLLYDLTELQRDGNKRYGYSAQKVLSIAQDLYEKRKLITYPRTDSRYVSQDMVPKLKQTLQKINVEPYKEDIQYILDKPKLPITKRIVNDAKVTDHHAVIPTDAVPRLNTLSVDERKIYDLIVTRFMAVFYPDYKYKMAQIVVDVEQENFLIKGKEIVQLGWMKFYKNESKEEEQELPNLEKGESVEVKECEVKAKQTQPPKPYTEASLLSAMENAGRFIEDEELKEQMKDSGLGTPATRAAIIERLLQVGYIQRKGKALYPTEKGMKLIEVVPDELKSPETTGKWEKGLTSISKGKMEPNRFMGSIVRYVQYLVQQSNEVQTTVIFPEEQKKKRKGSRKKTISKVYGKCPSCKEGEIRENSKAFYCTNWKKGCRYTTWKNSLEKYGQQVTADLMEILLKEEKIDGISMILPQTHEKCKATLAIKPDGTLEFKNVQRIEN